MRFVPADLRGRVFGLLRTMMQATPPLGALLAAPLLAAGGVRAAALATGGLVAVPALVALVARALDKTEPSLAPANRGPSVSSNRR